MGWGEEWKLWISDNYLALGRDAHMLKMHDAGKA